MAARKKAGTVSGAMERSIAAALDAGKLDADAQAVQIAAIRKVAAVMDEPDWPIICKDAEGKGKFDNVSPGTLLKYCEALGLNPTVAEEDKPSRGQLASMRAGIKAMAGRG